MTRRTVPLLVFALCAAFVSRAAFCEGPAQTAPATPATPPAPSGPAPQITFDAKDINLGDVVRGQDAVATFTYKNTGSAPLHILSAKPG